MQTLTQADFVRQIDAFLARHDMKPSRLGREATGEPALIDSIKFGKRSPTLATVEKLTNFMRAKDAEAATRAKLAEPLELLDPVEEAEQELPFSQAPGAAGASCATFSSTNGRPRSAAANPSCRSTAEAAAAAPSPNPSCSAEADAK